MVEGKTTAKIALEKPGALAGAIQRLFEDALELLPKGIRGNTKAENLDALRERLHLVEFGRWKNGSVKYDARRRGRAGEVRYVPLEYTDLLIALLEGGTYFDDRDKQQERADRQLAKDVVLHWKRPAAPEHLDDILALLKAHRKVLADQVAHFAAIKKAAERQDIANAASVARSTSDHARADGDRAGEALLVTAPPIGAGEMLDAPDSAGTAQEWPPLARVLRRSVVPLERPVPRPVNVLMALGVSRLPAVAVAVDLDARRLVDELVAVESMLTRIKDTPYSRRTWDLGSPITWVDGRERGAVWEVPDEVSTEEILRALAAAFTHRGGGCGTVVVFVLSERARARAQKLVETCAIATAAAGSGHVPVYLWSGGQSESSSDRSLLARIQSSVETGTSDDPSSDVQAVIRMRLPSSATLGPEWDRADSEQMRLHDLSVSASTYGDAPAYLDEIRAIELIARISSNQNLLYAVPFLPASEAVLDALNAAPELTRAVAGLVTPTEMRAPRPFWRRPLPEAYRAAPAPFPVLVGEPH